MTRKGRNDMIQGIFLNEAGREALWRAYQEELGDLRPRGFGDNGGWMGMNPRRTLSDAEVLTLLGLDRLQQFCSTPREPIADNPNPA